jgi:hypothetical protein
MPRSQPHSVSETSAVLRCRQWSRVEATVDPSLLPQKESTCRRCRSVRANEREQLPKAA